MDAAIAAIISGTVGAGIVAAATIIATRLQSRGDREERQKDRDEFYKQILYQERIKAHQEALYHIQEIIVVLGEFRTGIRDLILLEEDIKSSVRRACDFHDSRCLFLAQYSADKMRLVLAHTLVYLENPDKEYKQRILDELFETREAIIKGIELKHVPLGEDERKSP